MIIDSGMEGGMQEGMDLLEELVGRCLTAASSARVDGRAASAVRVTA